MTTSTPPSTPSKGQQPRQPRLRRSKQTQNGGPLKPTPTYNRRALWAILGIAGVSLLLLGGLAVWVALLFGINKGAAPEIALAPVVLVAVVILALAFGGMAVVLANLGLTDGTQALGLPQGSIRALLALLLILLFMVLSIYLFGQLEGSTRPTRTLEGVTTAELATIPIEDQVNRERAGGSNEEPLYTVEVRSSPSETVENFGMQLLTTMSTLVVAIAAFYFGSKSVEQAGTTGALLGWGAGRRQGRDGGDDQLEVTVVVSPDGTMVPPGSTLPPTVDDMNAEGVEANPSTPWTAGQFVELSNRERTKVYWDGTEWVEGTAPAEEE